MNVYKMVFLPDSLIVTVNEDENILDAAFRAGISLKGSCGGTGSCSRCSVIIKKGLARSEGVGKLTQEQLFKGHVLACQTYPRSDMEIEVPESTRHSQHQVLISEELNNQMSTHAFDPLFQKIKIALSPPSLDDHTDDSSRLFSVLRKTLNREHLRLNLETVQRLPRILREGNWQITVSLADIKGCYEIVNVEAGWNHRNYYGLALDIGTTTVVAQLVDLETGKSVGIEGTYNKQAVFGDDVISRIIYAVEHNKGVEQMQRTILTTIYELITTLIKDKNINYEDIWYITCAGNTTMIHLFLGIDPEYIRLEPYVPAFNSFIPIKALDIGLAVNPKAMVYCLPGTASYVGGDITAGAEVIGIDKQEKISLFIDVGTNGEMVLGNKDWLMACACSAGPAFEGGGIIHGMRAMDGAIEHVDIEPISLDVHLKTVNNKKPIGICGSGLIDCIAAMQTTAVINRNGSFLAFPTNKRIRITEGEKEFVLAWAGESGNGKDITISESDIKNLIRSKAAVFAGISTMLKTVGLALEDIEQIYVAGGFGKYINLADAIKIGMFPDLPLEKYKYVGNSSIMGAKKILLSKEARDDAEQLTGKIKYLELIVGNDFYEEFISALFLPHTNLKLFPSTTEGLR